MKRLIALISMAALMLLPIAASAQVSRDVAESAVDRQIEIEMNDGSSYLGQLMRVGETTVVVRVRTGRLIELERENIAAIFVEEPEPSGADRGDTPTPGERYGTGSYSDAGSRLPPPRSDAYVTDAEYEYARSQYYPARRLRFFGVMATAVGTAALAAGIGTRVGYNNSYCYDDYYYENDYDECNEGMRRASIAMFTLFPVLVGGGLTMAIIGGQKKAEHAPTLRTYRLQQQAERQRSNSHKVSASPSRPNAEFAVSPTFTRDGGGLRLHVSF